MTARPLMVEDGGRLPSVSVLLPAWNDAAILPRCLQSLLDIAWPALEIIVVAGGRDGTLDIARRFVCDRVIVIEQAPGQGKQAALQAAFDLSAGDVIYLTDADCVVPREAFQRVMEPVLSGEFRASTGASIPLPEQHASPLIRYQWGKDLFWGRQQQRTAGGVLGRNCAIQRQTLIDMGAFRERVHSGTDYHLSQRLRRAGVEIAWTASYVYSEYPDTPRAYLRMWRRWIKNVLIQGVTSRSYREVLSTGIGIATAMPILSGPLLAVAISPWTLVPWLCLLGYVSWKRWSSHRTVVSAGLVPPIPFSVAWIPQYVLLDALAALSGLVAALVPGMRRAW